MALRPCNRWCRIALSAVSLVASTSIAASENDTPLQLSDLIAAAQGVEINKHALAEYEQATETYREILKKTAKIEPEDLSFDDRVDLELLSSWLETRLFEIEDLELHRIVPGRYFALYTTDALFLRPCSQPDARIRDAAEELEALPEILSNARANLTRPARVWTENAIYTAWYAELLLRDMAPTACVDDPDLEKRFLEAAHEALSAVEQYKRWMQTDLLPRSTRSPAWKPGEIEAYQFGHERLHEYGVDEMLRIAKQEEQVLLEEMTALAARIHPTGDLATVWAVMKEEAPAWQEVLPMAQRYVDMASEWLAGPGSHVVTIPDNFDYGARITSPMGRRILSFGGADYGPTLAGRISGYYVLTPLESRLTDEQKASRIKSYNPYWTHVISYHEWIGHNVQRAHSLAGVERPMRRLFRSSYLSQAWSFYLEKLLEDEGYFEVLPHMEALKTRMARLQMRMWRVQRILTKLSMAKGMMSFEQAVDAYIEKIGMEPTNAFIEVQRDSQSPSPPGREIIGEMVILEMREEYKRRMGEHYRLADFHDALLQYGELPLPVVRDLMFGDG